MAKFYGWPPAAVEGLTGTRLAWWFSQAARIVTPRKAQENQDG